MQIEELQVPYIACYRKDDMLPELDINELWKVSKYHRKWSSLYKRKKSLMKLLKRVLKYQSGPSSELTNQSAVFKPVNLICKDDFLQIANIQNEFELTDTVMHIMRHHSHEILEVITMNDDASDDDKFFYNLSQSVAADQYSEFRKGGFLRFAQKFGLTPKQFAENVCDGCQQHCVKQEVLDLNQIAQEYIGKRFATVTKVLQVAEFVVAKQISTEPKLRKYIREKYFNMATIKVNPTKKGMSEINKNHSIYGMEHWEKPVHELYGDKFLLLHKAEIDGLVTLRISESSTAASYFDEMTKFYQYDGCSKNVTEWNELRVRCVLKAVKKMILPDLQQELRSILLSEAKSNVILACADKLRDWIKPGPYRAIHFDEKFVDWQISNDLRIMGVVYSDNPLESKSQYLSCVIINTDGHVIDSMETPKLASPLAPNWDVISFLRRTKPQVIAVASEKTDESMARAVKRDLKFAVGYLNHSENFPKIPVQILSNDLAKVYAHSKKGQADFPTCSIFVRQAISLARRLRDPLIEFSQLSIVENEILSIHFHQLQDEVPKNELIDSLNFELIKKTSEVGFDINLAIQNPLIMNLSQFVCGLCVKNGLNWDMSGQDLLRSLDLQLKNRFELVTVGGMSETMFINSSGFIKITHSSGSGTNVGELDERLDGSRVHPECYEWARKIMKDAFGPDADGSELNQIPKPCSELPKHVVTKLESLDLVPYADDLQQQGYGNQIITLSDIREELISPYKELRLLDGTTSH